MPPSTRARWQWKLRLATYLYQLFPVSVFVVEDVAAMTKKGKRRWNTSFSPLEVGKHWFSEEISKLAPLQIRQGYETKTLRDQLGFKKTSKKLAEVWEAHCVDAWCLASRSVGGNTAPDHQQLVCIAPLTWHHRQLHRFRALERREEKAVWRHALPGNQTGNPGHAPQVGRSLCGWEQGWQTEFAR